MCLFFFVFLRKLADKETKENKTAVAAARQALMTALEEDKDPQEPIALRLPTLFAGAHQLSLDGVPVDLTLVSMPMFAITENLVPANVLRKITGIVDVIRSALKKNGYPTWRIVDNVLKSFSKQVEDQVDFKHKHPLSCNRLVHIYWPLVRCIFETVNECDQSVFSIPIVETLVTEFLRACAQSPMHTVVF